MSNKMSEITQEFAVLQILEQKFSSPRRKQNHRAKNTFKAFSLCIYVSPFPWVQEHSMAKCNVSLVQISIPSHFLEGKCSSSSCKGG